jgi:hypothetical protein
MQPPRGLPQRLDDQVNQPDAREKRDFWPIQKDRCNMYQVVQDEFA